MDRRENILNEIKKSNKPISATYLAKLFGVSRQIIVGDIALIRASGTNIIATPRGYVLDKNINESVYTIAVKHNVEHLADELYTIVDYGAEVVDVIVEHPVYGQLSGSLHLTSRYDVEQFLAQVITSGAKPLSQLTNGLHLHTIICKDDETYQRIVNELDKKGYLFKK